MFYLLAVNPAVQEKLLKEIDEYYSSNPVSRNLKSAINDEML